jgi:hypothetical protein
MTFVSPLSACAIKLVALPKRFSPMNKASASQAAVQIEKLLSENIDGAQKNRGRRPDFLITT